MNPPKFMSRCATLWRGFHHGHVLRNRHVFRTIARCLPIIFTLALPMKESEGAPAPTFRFSYNKTGMLRTSFSYREALDDIAIRKKLKSGLKVVVVMRAAIHRDDDGPPIWFMARTCQIAFDLWNEVYNVVIDNAAAVPVLPLGLYRRCTDIHELELLSRKAFNGRPDLYFLKVRVEVNPVSDEVMKKLQGWVRRATGVGSTGIGDSLFGSFIGAFMKKIASADKILEMKSPYFPP